MQEKNERRKKLNCDELINTIKAASSQEERLKLFKENEAILDS